MQPTIETDVLGALSQQLGDAIAQIGTTLVRVDGRARQSASGVVFAPNLVLTANHVLERDEQISVETSSQRTLPARVVGRDPTTDLAVLRVEQLGNSAATVATTSAFVGQVVLAVGRPASSGPMASIGVVSAVGGPLRSGRNVVVQRFIQTDATPYPGFSGGPLINGAGEVLGVITTGLVNGLPIAIPGAIAWGIGETLLRQGYIRRGYLGISSQAVELPQSQRAGISQAQGLLVIHVEADSPAERSGLLLGDIIMQLDQAPVTGVDDLQVLLTGDRVGRPVIIEIIRGGTLHTLPITIAERR